MNVLWISNTIYPSAAEKLDCKSLHSVSWIDAMANAICGEKDCNLAIYFPSFTGSGYKKSRIDDITFYVTSSEESMKDDIDKVIEDFRPDIIHAYGTEQKHNYYIINKHKEIPVIISLQGIITGYIADYFGGLNQKEIVKATTFGALDFIIRRGVFVEYDKWKKQIPYEKKILQSSRYFEGRSDWDKAISLSVNPDAKYFYLPRAIRSGFYRYDWNPDSLNNHSILIHQGNDPRKGIHFIIRALALLKNKYSDITLYVLGNSPKTGRWIKGYEKYIYDLVEELQLSDHVSFLGKLSDVGVAEQLSQSGICVVGSSIDNAPNAIAEAMIVGTPVLSSYTGGSPSMLGYGDLGYLYPYNEPELLASRIQYMFENQDEVMNKANAAKKVAYERHNIDTLKVRLLQIYGEVYNENYN